jgi:Fe-S oxidoreductase
VKVINEPLLALFRQPGKCEACHANCPQGRDPHHILSKGAGRVDCAGNLVSLCRTCHTGFHTSGKPSKAELLMIAAKREKTTPEEITATVYRFRRCDLAKVWDVSSDGQTPELEDDDEPDDRPGGEGIPGVEGGLPELREFYDERGTRF